MADISARELRERTRGLDDTSRVLFQAQYSADKKSRGIATILAVIWPGWDRFYLGQIGPGIFKWITAGGVFIWWFIDIFTAAGRADELNRNKALEITDSLRTYDAPSESPPGLEDSN